MSLLITVVALAAFAALHYAVHGLARHFTAAGIGVRGTAPVFRISDAEAYAESPRSRRIIAAAAGPIANYLLCALTFMAALMVGGTKETTTTIQVVPSMPAAEAGLHDGDRVIAVDGKPISTFAEVSAAVKAPGAQEVALEVKRGRETLRRTIPVRNGRIGVMAKMERRSADPVAAGWTSIVSPIEMIHLKFFARREAQFTGPIGIVAVKDVDARDDAAALLTIFASYTSVAWPLSILVAFLANRARRRRADYAST